MFLQHPYQFKFFVRQVVIIIPRLYSTKPKTALSVKNSSRKELSINFFSKNIGSKHSKWSSILDKHPELKCLKPKDVINSMSMLRKLEFSFKDVLSKPLILNTSEQTLENRYFVLKECGFEQITISVLSKYMALVNRNVTTLKSFGYIPQNLNVIEQLQHTFTDIQVQLHTKYACNEDLELKVLRQNILNYYLQQRLHMSNAEIERVWSIYGRLKHKSYRSVQIMIKILLDELKFSTDRIIKNGFILHAGVDNVQRIIKEIPTINGQDIKEILFKKPKIMMSSCDALMATLEHVKSFGIGEEAVIKCLDILTLGPDTVLERLKSLNEIKEFQVLITNPRVLKLVHYQKKAKLRLNYLSHLKGRCASLHILSCGSKAFAKFTRDGSNRTKGCDIVVYLANILNHPEGHIRNLLSLNPNWFNIQAAQVKQCFEFLQSKNFSKIDIYNNIQLLVYPIKRIDEKLQQLQKPIFLQQLQINKRYNNINRNEILTLVLYLIESEFHFTGDGVWTKEHTQYVENFNNLLPDFPENLNKIQKYDTKPSDLTAKISSVK